MKAAIESSGGLAGVRVILLSLEPANTSGIKFEGISFLYNFQLKLSGVQMWKAYNIGPGRLFSWNKFHSRKGSPSELNIIDPSSQENSSFRQIKLRKSTAAAESEDTSSESEVHPANLEREAKCDSYFPVQRRAV